MNIDNHVIFSQQDPDDPQVDTEGTRSRLARIAQTEEQFRASGLATKRAARLDKYFSKTPPNGKLLDVFRGTLVAFKNTNGETPRWLSYEQVEASFDRLQRKGILTIEAAEDALGCRTFKSEAIPDAVANRRNVRPAELDAIVAELKKNLGDSLGTPPLEERSPVHGCRYVPVINKWRVSLFFGGRQHALGCYPFATALRLQDALAYHFSAYRRPAAYNTSEAEAVELLGKHLALQAFASALETHWLAAGVLRKPVEIISTECRLTAVEKKLDDILKLMQTKAT